MKKDSKIVDLTYLEGMAEGNEELIKELVEIFRKQVPDFVDEMNEYYNRQDWASLGAVAHKAKSSVYIMGMSDLAADLKTFELIAKKGENIEIYPEFIANFKKVCNEALEELDRLF